MEVIQRKPTVVHVELRADQVDESCKGCAVATDWINGKSRDRRQQRITVNLRGRPEY